MPLNTQAYSFDILWLNDKIIAVLDIPQPDYISTAQSLLALEES